MTRWRACGQAAWGGGRCRPFPVRPVVMLALALGLWWPGGWVRAQTRGEGLPGGKESAGESGQTRRRYAIFKRELSCEQAAAVSRRAVQRLGFRVTSADPAQPGASALIKGVRDEALGREHLTVEVDCRADGVHVDSESDLPPCEQANRISYRAVERLGFTITSFKPAADGGKGLVQGVRRSGSHGPETVALTITCGPDAVLMETTSEDNPLLASEDFYLAIGDVRRGFFALFNAMTEGVAYREPGAAQRLRVVIEPVSKSQGPAAQRVFAVRVEIANMTAHAYRLEAENISLLTTRGERVRPLPRTGEDSSGPALARQTLAPGATATGYLYYPPGSYTGARGYVTDTDTREREGFARDF